MQARLRSVSIQIKQVVEQFFGDIEACLAKSANRAGQMDQATAGGLKQNSKEPNNPNSATGGLTPSLPLIDNEALRLRRLGESNRLPFPATEIIERGIGRDFDAANLQPGWSIHKPHADRRGRVGRVQLVEDSLGNDHSLVYPGKDVDLLDQDEVVDGRRICNDDHSGRFRRATAPQTGPRPLHPGPDPPRSN